MGEFAIDLSSLKEDEEKDEWYKLENGPVSNNNHCNKIIIR
jgi:hypothetical protein